jgi:large subunit ribosomal protein L17
MHRHGYKGKKFGRETDQRRALMKSLAEALILKESIETTLPKAKEVKGYVEKLITKAKKGDLHNRRQVISGLQTLNAATKLIDGITPQLGARNSGYLRVKRTTLRRGDNAQMAVISFVDELKEAARPAAPKPIVKKAPARKPAAKRTVKPKVAA